MTDKTYNELLDELDSYNQRTLTATETYENNLGSLQTTLQSCEVLEGEASASADAANSSAISAADSATEAQNIADSINPEIYTYARQLTDFYAERAQNNERYAASGFVHHGKHGSENINEGLYTDTSTPNVLLIGGGANGNSKTEQPTVNVAGSISELSLLNDSSISTIKLSPAPDGTVTYDSATGAIVQHADSATAFAAETATNKVVTERVDMFGLEAWLEEITAANPYAYPLGLIQSQASTFEGLSTSTSSRPVTYYAVYDGDTSSQGKGYDFFNATTAEKEVMLSNPEHNIYFEKETGKWLQWRIRQRTIAGAGNENWRNIDPSIDEILGFDSYTEVGLQGRSNTVTTETFSNSSDNSNKRGLFYTESSSYSHNGECCFYVIGSVPR